MLIAKTGGGLKTKKRKKAFTLIELLAIIVILAIIAVITVPIILNIIENSRKGAATDSAYGYKDSVNKYYIQRLSDNNKLKLNDTYTVTNGTLSGGSFGDPEVTSFPVQVSGTVPSSGELTYSNNVLTEGWLVIGDYRVTFNQGGTVTTTKNSGSSSETHVDQYSMAEMCPGCVFAKTGTWQALDTELEVDTQANYTGLGPEFIGYVKDENDIVKRIFICGIYNSASFCLEGGAGESIYEHNIEILNHFLPNICDYAEEDESEYQCYSEEPDFRANTTTHDHDSAFVAGNDGYGCHFNIITMDANCD